MAELDLNLVRRSVSEYISKGSFDGRVVDALMPAGVPIPIESELWDYKRELGTDAVALAAFVLQATSFYNAYGGFLVYGIEEDKDARAFSVVGAALALNQQQLRTHLRNYTGAVIDVAVGGGTVGDKSVTFVYVPKRPVHEAPIGFGKDGPVSGNKPLFRRETVYFRRSDNCVPAEGRDDYAFLFGPRDNAYLWSAVDPSSFRRPPSLVVSHTLPDRNLVCPAFVGRKEILGKLWKWLGDDFNRVKLLVGEGGKGKTSIAYTFCEEVYAAQAYELDRIVWLSAKARRFVGQSNSYVEMPETHFSDSRTFLEALASQLPLIGAEVEGASDTLLKRHIRSALDQTSSLIVVDDVDSAELEEQKEIINAVFQIAGTRARVMVTTRMNFALGADLSIAVGGLDAAEFDELVADLTSDLSVSTLTKKEVASLFRLTEGSPLFAESVLRLLKTGMKIDQAARQWKGKMGAEVRDAALKKEIDLLSPQSRRLLYACAAMGQASMAELKQVTKYIDDRLHDCIGELQRLFLLPAPKITKGEPRFFVSENTKTLVLENAKSLVVDAKSIDSNIHKLRAAGTHKTETPVGAAINQAVALLREGNYQDAIATIDAAASFADHSSDLVSTRGLCHLAMAQQNKSRTALDVARRDFKRSWDMGHRKGALYERWYEAEALAADWVGAMEVASLAITDKIQPTDRWLRYRASAAVELGRSQLAASNIELAVQGYADAANDLAAALEAGPAEAAPVRPLLWQVHDDGWEATKSRGVGIPELRASFEFLRGCFGRGDRRGVIGTRCMALVSAMLDGLPSSLSLKESQRNLLQQTAREADAIVTRVEVLPGDRREWSHLLDQWRATKRRAAGA